MQIYTYVKTLLCGNILNSKWVTQTEPTQLMSDLLTNHFRSFIVIFNTFTQQQAAIESEFLKATLQNRNISIADYLIDVDNTVIPTIAVPEIKARRVRYKGAVRAGYTLDTVRLGYSNDADIILTDRVDLRLTRDDINYDDFNDFCLTTVNGYFHNFAVSRSGIYIPEAAESMKVCGYNHVGIYNFKEVGGLTKVAMDQAEIAPLTVNGKLKDGFAFDVKQDCSSKYVLFFIGGYMVTASDNLITQTGNSTFTFAFEKFNWLDKFFEMSRFLNLKKLGLVSSPTNEQAFFRDDIVHDNTVRNLFKLPQTFMALVDSTSFFVERELLPVTRLPGIYQAHGKFENYPLQLGHGRMAEYWTKKDDGKPNVMTLFVADGFKFQRNYNSADVEEAIVIDSKRPIGRRIMLSDAFLINMGRDY